MKINKENIPEIIKNEYGFSVFRIEKLNTGFDQNTDVYKLFSSGRNTFFLKMRSKNFTESSLVIPSWLSTKMDLPNIIHPIKTLGGKLYHKVSSFYIALFPYINGRSGWDISLTKDQFGEFGKFMRDLHSADLPNGYKNLIPWEKYNQKYSKDVKKCLAGINNKVYDNPVVMDFLYILKNNENTILEMADHLETAGIANSKGHRSMCLCHGDIHAGNILIDKNKFYVVDWDTIILAPKEKDLMFIGGGIGNKWNGEGEIECFYKGYGTETEIDRDLIKYYRYERIIQDICEFYRQMLDTKTSKEEQKKCYELFKEIFKRNNVVDIALRT
jgi:spectinomycin phosphotransferase